MAVKAPHIKRPGLLGLLAAMSAAAGLAACFSLLSLAGIVLPAQAAKSAGILEKTQTVTEI